MALDSLIVLLGALAGGFVSGLAGFGTGLVAIGIWLHAIPPVVAAPLAMICSVVSQLQTLPAIWHAIRPRRVLPFILPGLLGVPIGTALLAQLDPAIFRIGIGVLLLAFSSFSLLWGRSMTIAWGGRRADMAIGFASGILGGLAGLSGVLPTVWATLRGWGKEDRRSLFQAFNLTILAAAALTHAVSGHLAVSIGWSILTALPGTLVGAWLGVRAYRKLSDRHFNTLILYLLAFSGATLLWSNT